MSGHLFLVQGDITRLACDAWLLPCDVRAQPGKGWLRHLPIDDPPPWPQTTVAWRKKKLRALKVRRWEPTQPQPWLVNVGASGAAVSWYVEGAAQFLARVADDLHGAGARPRHRRAKHLVALPVVGTGGGGAYARAGEVLRELIPALHEGARAHDLDVVLVARDALSFAAAQAQRGVDRHAWPELTDPLWHASEQLARHAASNQLVLFIGAGVSIGAGLPGWGDLLEQLARGAGFHDHELEGFRRMEHLDQARLIEMQLERDRPRQVGRRVLGQAVAEAFAGYPCHALAHALLSALPVREVVTTNYDQLFEHASEDAGRSLAVLPHAPAIGADRWLLKMHGCVSDPERIVLTREDYLRYDQHRQALAGIVQALLLMRHMLFIGFSLRDENFHRIADAVRRARRPAQGAGTGSGAVDQFGTVLDLASSPLRERLWAEDLRWVTMDQGATQSLKQDEAARRLEILLDSILARTGMAHHHLLDRRHEGALRPEERALKGHLERFLEGVEQDPIACSATAWSSVESMARGLGWAGPRTVSRETASGLRGKRKR